MNAADIQKKREALKLQLFELEKQDREIARVEKAKAAERLKKNYENNRDSLAAILWKLHSKDFADLDVAVLKQEVSAILTPPKTKVVPATKTKTKNVEAVSPEPELEVDAAFTESEPVDERPTLSYCPMPVGDQNWCVNNREVRDGE